MSGAETIETVKKFRTSSKGQITHIVNKLTKILSEVDDDMIRLLITDIQTQDLSAKLSQQFEDFHRKYVSLKDAKEDDDKQDAVIMEAMTCSFQLIGNAFDKVDIEDSDAEDEHVDVSVGGWGHTAMDARVILVSLMAAFANIASEKNTKLTASANNASQ